MGVRKNHESLTKAEWKAFIAAIDAMHGTAAIVPAYRTFTSVHVDAMSMAHMDWDLHRMSMGRMMRPKK